MGLLKGLALLPLAPIEAVVCVARLLQEQVDRELLDPQGVLAELEWMQSALDEGLISEDEYTEVEDELLGRLEAMEGMR